MELQRHIDEQIRTHFDKYRQVLILLGARQVGKTTLLKRVFPNATYLLADNEGVSRVLELYDINTYKQIIGSYKEIIIDEIHLLSDPGRAIKILYDQLEGIKLIITGSSALNIKNKSTESLAGRKIEYSLFPLTFSEYLTQNGIESKLNSRILTNLFKDDVKDTPYFFNLEEVLENVMTYGLYPETLQLSNDREYLENLANSVIFKDLLELDVIEKRKKALELLKLLAYQIGNTVSYLEISRKIELDIRTVKRYVDIFEESFIIYRLHPFSRSKRDEIGKAPKIYFYDLGLRNALINNFDKIALRSDSGAMFENFIITEVKKLISYTKSQYNMNFWRLKNKTEVDLLLSKGKEILGFEIKYHKGEASKVFKNRYPDARLRVITATNFY